MYIIIILHLHTRLRGFAIIIIIIIIKSDNKFTVTDKGIYSVWCTPHQLLHLVVYPVGAEAVSIISNRVTIINIQTRFRVDEDTWPPDKPKNFTPLLLIHHEGQHHNMYHTVEVAKLIQKGDIISLATKELSDKPELHGHAPHTHKVTKDMMDILAPLEKNDEPQFIMIDGAPGIGKSVLLREIAFMWGKQQILKGFKLVLLLCLRDPNVQQATSVNHLLQLFCEGDDSATEITKPCSDYLFKTGGKEMVVLLDGYDELPVKLQTNSLVAKILSRRVLPNCGLIVSSRPHASVTLREQATISADILGFTDDEQRHYIEHSLKGHPQCIEKLIHYLEDHPIISNLCLVPFNIVILLFLRKMGIPLPSDTSKLYHHFICLTICRHLAKSGHNLENNTITDLDHLPEPCSKIVKQLSKLALQALNNNQLVFTYDDIKVTCPDVIATSEAINGYGLLHAAQHFGLTGKTMTFNFLHITIQEYLAARYIITQLSPDEELCLLQKKFWSDVHANMFAIYVSLTKGQRSAFKQFLCGGNNKITIAEEFLNDQLKCLHLFHCFHEASDRRICESIEKAAVFNKKEIDVSEVKLSSGDIECLCLFLTSSSHKQWVKVNLYDCYIQDRGLHIIHKYLNDSGIIITQLWLSFNGLTQTSSSFISNIVLSCKVEMVMISDNSTIGDNEELYTMLSHPSSVVTCLFMDSVTLSSTSCRALFASVKDSTKLKFLYISHNNITDDVADDMANALAVNKSLHTLVIYSNPISGEGIQLILQALTTNKILEELQLPRCPPEKLVSLKDEINNMRTKQGITQHLNINFI